MKIEGKRVLITGGSSGIGLALAQAMLAKSAKVVVTGRRPEALARAIEKLRGTGSPVWSVTADVATPQGRDETITQAVAALGGLDILVNNAGGVRAGRLESTPEAELRAMIEVDLVAPILLTRAVLPALRESGEAMVANVASGFALIGVPFLCDLCRHQSRSRTLRRSAAPQAQGRRRACADRPSRWDRHADDEVKPRGARATPSPTPSRAMLSR
jgi:NAD(P)-dependent dehydrogenase (short-subunit alcohol dehydrogenase family)